MGAASAAPSTRSTVTPMAASTAGVAAPMATCHGLNSAHSPRIVTTASSGKRQLAIRDSMLTQLPTPLDCISRTARCPPSQAPAAMATPSSSVVSTVAATAGSARSSSISRDSPASGT